MTVPLTVTVPFTMALALVATGAPKPADRVFTYRQAEQARLLAQTECKPLVIHFVPDTKLGDEQFESFYRGPEAVPASLLDDVVIVAVPTQKFASLARQLGIGGGGGYRTISAYDLNPMEGEARATVRSGFV
jgi:hypothetical protein